MLVVVTTLIINYFNNRCPNCKKWQIRGFDRVDDEAITEVEVSATAIGRTPEGAVNVLA